MAFIPVSLVSFLLYAVEPLVPNDSGEDEVIGNVQVFPFLKLPCGSLFLLSSGPFPASNPPRRAC